MSEMRPVLLRSPALPTAVALEWVPRAPELVAQNPTIVGRTEVWDALLEDGQTLRWSTLVAVLCATPPERVGRAASLIAALHRLDRPALVVEAASRGTSTPMWDLIVAAAEAAADDLAMSHAASTAVTSQGVPLEVRRRLARYASVRARVHVALTDPDDTGRDVRRCADGPPASTREDFAAWDRLAVARPELAGRLAALLVARHGGDSDATRGFSLAADLVVLRCWSTAPSLCTAAATRFTAAAVHHVGPTPRKGRVAAAGVAVLAAAGDAEGVPELLREAMGRWAAQDRDPRSARWVARYNDMRAPQRTLGPPAPADTDTDTEHGDAAVFAVLDAAWGTSVDLWRLGVELAEPGLELDEVCALVDSGFAY